MLSHLNAAESVSLQYMQKKMQAGDKMENSGPFNSLRMWLCNGVASELTQMEGSFLHFPTT